jgi:hypothetical protein
LFIHQIEGVELEKEQPNTSEDFFNRSVAIYERNGTTHTFHLLYVRYFEEKLEEELIGHEFWKPFLRVFKIRELAAITVLGQNEAFKNRKRVYINEYEDFKGYFIQPDEQKLLGLLTPLLLDKKK